ncbi:class I SAM-dependent methyltransferase [Yinghuangia sp. ASG 101]|uniref:class I SAM-dependent methyltransferase n=1 Tax=Yinghuangia sp. ASG 101 TaxID=2896848 RepID=UPI001E488A9A|nr:class I SAM-dependent methyltransferase [Yinghuangia sp. ASG 101]UGQ15117.1 class I SAM-dependent methyltransferase [Yinghuangia sp. ASG 101]
MTERIAGQLTEVPETALWALYHRAAEARRPDAVLQDPRAIELVRSLDYAWKERFGAVSSRMAQMVALRARCYDAAVQEFLHRHPKGTVIALGEGLDTQFWRVDNGHVHWMTVDLAEPAGLRAQFLPSHGRQRTVVCDVRDPRWLQEAGASSEVMITAQGLLMYLRPAEVRELLAACATHFPGGRMVFDAVPRWVRDRVRSGQRAPGSRCRTAPMHWAMDLGEHEKLRTAHPGISEVRNLPMPPGRGFVFRYLMPRAGSLPGFRRLPPPVVQLGFAAS